MGKTQPDCYTNHSFILLVNLALCGTSNDNFINLGCLVSVKTCTICLMCFTFYAIIVSILFMPSRFLISFVSCGHQKNISACLWPGIYHHVYWRIYSNIHIGAKHYFAESKSVSSTATNLGISTINELPNCLTGKEGMMCLHFPNRTNNLHTGSSL